MDDTDKKKKQKMTHVMDDTDKRYYTTHYLAACEAGDLAEIKRCLIWYQFVMRWSLWEDSPSDGFALICRRGHEHVWDWLVESKVVQIDESSLLIQESFVGGNKHIICSVMSLLRIHLLQKTDMYSFHSPCNTSFTLPTSTMTEVFSTERPNSLLSEFRKLLETIYASDYVPQNQLVVRVFSYIFGGITENGNVNWLQDCLQFVDSIVCPEFRRPHGFYFPSAKQFFFSLFWEGACKHGHIHMLNLLLESIGDDNIPHITIHKGWQVALKFKQIHILSYFETVPPLNIFAPHFSACIGHEYYNTLLLLAIKANNLDCVKKVCERYQPTLHHLQTACENGNLTVIQTIHIGRQSMSWIGLFDCLLSCVKNRHQEAAEWMLRCRYVNIPELSETQLVLIFTHAVKAKLFQLAKQIFPHISLHIRTPFNLNMLNDVESLRWLVQDLGLSVYLSTPAKLWYSAPYQPGQQYYWALLRYVLTQSKPDEPISLDFVGKDYVHAAANSGANLCHFQNNANRRALMQLSLFVDKQTAHLKRLFDQTVTTNIVAYVIRSYIAYMPLSFRNIHLKP
jgi:hypothetical protein